MASITTRAGKGSPLTHNEVDANFTNLNTDKLDTAGIALGSAASPTLKFTGDPNTGLYSPGADQLAISTGGTGRLFVASAGNVGIGTSAPATLLHLSGSSTTALVRIANTGSGVSTFDGSGAGLELIAGNSNLTDKYAPAIKFGSTDSEFTTTNPKFGAALTAEAAQTYSSDTTGGMDLAFWTAPANPGTESGLVERMRIRNDGRLLIGTSNTFGVSALIQANSTSPANVLDLIRQVADTTAARLIFTKTRGSLTTSVNSGDGLGTIRFHGSDGTDVNSFGASIDAVVDGTPGTDDMPGRLVFSTTPSGSATPTERLRITSAGLVGIGTSAPTSLLHLSSATGSASPTPTELRIATTTNASDWSTTNPWGRISFYSADTSGTGPKIHAAIDAISQDSAQGVSSLNFRTSLSTGVLPIAMTIDNVGRVGIGTTAPGGTLDIKAAAATAPLIVQGSSSEFARIDSSGRLLVGTSTALTVQGINPALQQASTAFSGVATAKIGFNSDTSTCGSVFLGKSKNSTVAIGSVVALGDRLGVLRFLGDDGTAMVPAAEITAAVDGTPGTNDMPGRLVFSTTAAGASSPTERMRITSAGVLQIADAGNISVGTTTGTKIGTATTQKLGFFDKTPVVQPAAVANATDAASVITQLNALLARMRDLGLIAT